MENKKIIEKAKERLQPFLNSYTQTLLDLLVEDDIIRKKKNQNNKEEISYEFIPGFKNGVNYENLSQNEIKSINSFLEFKEIVTNVYYNLKYEESDKARALPLSKLIEKFINMEVFEIPIVNESRLKDIFDVGERLLDDNEIEEDAIKLFKENNINFTLLETRLLEFYTQEIASRIFPNFKFEKNKIIEETPREFDLVGIDEKGVTLIFEIKYRKRTLSTIKDILFQCYESLIRYDKFNEKNNVLALVLFLDKDVDYFDKIQYMFKKSVEELFPTYLGRIVFLPVSTKKLHLIEDEFKKLLFIHYSFQFETLKYDDKPNIVPVRDQITTNTSFLKSGQGSFAVWVKLKPVQECYKKLMNNEYIISHSTDYSSHIKGYPNVFSLSLTPNFTNITRKYPTELRWRVWISNSNRENLFLNGPLLFNQQEQWYHLLVRWNHVMQIVEFLIDGKLVAKNTKYSKFWPNEILDLAYVGSWGGINAIHYIGVPLFRLIASSEFLTDGWVETELRNKPILY